MIIHFKFQPIVLNTFWKKKKKISILPIQMHRDSNLTLSLKGQRSTYDHHLNKHGSPWVPNYILRFWLKAFLVLENKIFFYHIWAWWPPYLMGCDYLYTFSIPLRKKVAHKENWPNVSEEKSFKGVDRRIEEWQMGCDHYSSSRAFGSGKLKYPYFVPWFVYVCVYVFTWSKQHLDSVL